MTAASLDLCPNCGAKRPTNAPHGLCPRCLLQRGLASDVAGLAPADGSHATHDRAGAASVVETLAATFGLVPHVLLRDTDPGAEPPVHRPGSPEMPPQAQRSARLHLLGEIARGGMGAVLKGRDVDLGRDLAVKVLLETHRDKPELVHRFIEEAQIAGQLQHPGIAPIYELGVFADRRPYFTMKLVKGRTLAELLCDRGEGGTPRLLGIFESVGQTVAYAHARGVIHRDLKPSNVMVGNFGEVQVMDWGLAKVLLRGGVAADATAGKVADDTVIVTARSGRSDSDPDLSRAGSVMGTPSYMAPEQARGDVGLVDERVDVFALGSILCEILTGQPALTGRTSAEIQRLAARGDVTDALKRLDACGGDGELVELARACLAPEPGDRPRDAAGVTARLTAYQRGVQERLRTAELARAAEAARAEEARHTAQAERRARRLTLGLAAAVVGLIVVSGGGYAWTLRQRYQRRVQTAVAVDAALAEMLQLRDRARGAPGKAGPWAEALAAARRAETVLAQGDADDPLRRQVATQVAALVRERDAAAADRQLLAALEVVRGSGAENGEAKRSDAEYDATFRKAGLDLDATDPERAGAWVAGRTEPVELASYLDDWASVRRTAGRPKADWRRLVEAARAADPDPWRDVLRAKIAMQDRETDAAIRALADDTAALDAQPVESLVLLAHQLRYGIGDSGRADAVLRRAWRRYPGDYWLNLNLANARPQQRSSGRTPDIFRRHGEAVRYSTAAVAIRPGSAWAHVALGMALQDAGDFTGAIAEQREAIRLQPDLALAYQALSDALRESGDLPGAVATARQLLSLRPDHAMGHYALGNALRASGDLPGAVAEHREGIRLRPDHAQAHMNLGTTLHVMGNLPGAIAEHREAIRLEPDFAQAHISLGTTLWASGDLPGAIAEYREAIRLKPDHVHAHLNLGITLCALGDLSGAIAEHREAIRLHPDNARAHASLASELLERGNRAAAMAEVHQALLLDPTHLDAMTTRGEILLVNGQFAEALPDLERTRARLAELGGQPVREKRTADLVSAVRWLVDHEADLAALTADRPRERAELACLDLATLSQRAGRPALAAQLYHVAFAASPTLADGRRLDAARAAARAEGGQGEDHPPPDGAAKVILRRQALDCLKAELAALSRSLDPADPRSRATVTATLDQWKSDPDLAGVGGTKALGALPEDERREWRAFWSQVETLGKKAGGGAP